MNVHLIRFHRPSLRGLFPDNIALSIPCTNLSVSIHRDTGGPARWQHAPFADGSGGELQCGRRLLIYGVESFETLEDPAWASESAA